MFIVKADTAEQMRQEVIQYLERCWNSADREHNSAITATKRKDENTRMRVFFGLICFFKELEIEGITEIT